jgi:2-methylaconitate cis-trans-isomerase PrpF
MMREIPSAADLLDTARDLLRNDLAPSMAPDQRHLALMIANAMAIARRQLDDGEAPELRELAALGELYGLPLEAAAGQLQTELSQRNRLLCQAIRTGQADPGTVLHSGVQAALQMVSRAKVAQSNPRYLEGQ